MIRSGYPALILGDLGGGGGHATCAVGFRSAVSPVAASGTVVLQDADIPFIYVHDDNLGPSVRFAISVDADGVVNLTPDAPPRVVQTATPDPTLRCPAMIPSSLVVAVPDELRTSPDALHVAGLQTASTVSVLLDVLGKQAGNPLPGLSMSTRFSRLRDYLSRDLEQVGLLGRALSDGLPELTGDLRGRGTERLSTPREIPCVSRGPRGIAHERTTSASRMHSVAEANLLVGVTERFGTQHDELAIRDQDPVARFKVFIGERDLDGVLHVAHPGPDLLARLIGAVEVHGWDLMPASKESSAHHPHPLRRSPGSCSVDSRTSRA